MKRCHLSTIAMVAAALVAASCSYGPEPAASADRLVVAASDEPLTLNSLYRSSPADDLATWSVNEGLVDLTAEGELVPVLAAEVPSLVPDDRQRWRVNLRSGIEFTNGTPLTAEIVKRNIDLILEPRTADDADALLIGILDTLDGAEVVDKDTVDILTKTPDVEFAYKLAMLRIIEPDATRNDKAVGTGPYVLESWRRGQSIVLTENPNYWGKKKPTVDEVELRFISDAATRMSALKSGEVHIATDISADQAKSAPKVITSSTAVESMTFRLNASASGPLGDPNFRRALNYAVDKEALSDALFGGLFQPLQCQTVGPESATFNGSLKAYSYNPQRARELLGKVDIPADFTLTLTADNGSLNNEARELTLAVTDYYRSVGLEVSTRFIDTPTYLKNLIDYASGAKDESAPQALYLTSDDAYNSALRFIETYILPDGKNATVGAKHNELVGTLNQARQTFDEKARLRGLNTITKAACDDAFFVYLLEKKPIYGATANVKYAPGYGELVRFNFADVSMSPAN